MAILAGPSVAIVCSLQDDAEALAAVEKIIAEYNQEQQSFYERIQAAENDEERQEIFAEGFPDPSQHFDKLKEIATSHPGTDAAAAAASWVVGMGGRGMPGGPDTSWAVDMMLTDFVDSEHIADITFMFSGLSTKHINALEAIRKSKNERAKALGDYMRGAQFIQLAKAAKEIAEPGSSGDPYVSYYMQGMDEELREKLATDGIAAEYHKAGEELLAFCRETYKDVEFYPGSGIMVAAKADGDLFEMHNLQIGNVAPDIEGVDAEGVSFRLSDYKGKVVVLDFWGFW